MKRCFAYIRVSTAKQGEHGVSLQEQKDAIARFAERNTLLIVNWFEERETAAKRGRPVFANMIKQLKAGMAQGIIMHKIDRSARNLRDWADLGELIDQGVDMHFVNEGLDLRSRGGRLSADIQAVVAADFIRNLREETRKGFYGRLKQGLYPLPAPIGYLDQGKGKPKIPDPLKAPLVRKIFEMYATGRYGLIELIEVAVKLGLRNRNGKEVSLTGLSVMLNNPFYVGLIRLRRTKENFSGTHEPIVKTGVFRRVQQILKGRTAVRGYGNVFLFRRFLKCQSCQYSLIAERQKGHVYYRCHTRSCPATCIREEDVSSEIARQILPLHFTDEDKTYLQERIAILRQGRTKTHEDHVRSIDLSITSLEDRISRLTDAYLDEAIDRELFEQKKTTLLLQKKALEEQRGYMRDGATIADMVKENLELAGSVSSRYILATDDEKRDLLSDLASNCSVEGKNVSMKLKFPFSEVAERMTFSNGAPYRDRPRTLDALIVRLTEILSKTDGSGVKGKSAAA